MSTRKTKTTTVTTNNRNRNNKRTGRKKRRNVKPSGSTTSAVKMAHCTRLYAKALTNPFAVQGLPCIPDNIVIPSFKFMTKARGVFSTGTNGYGFCIIDPFQMAANDGSFDGSNPLPVMGGAIYYTEKTYPGTTVDFVTGGAGAWALQTGVRAANSNSQFSVSDWMSLIGQPGERQFRLVGCGLRVRYIGSNLYNAGRLVIFRNQGGSTLDVTTLIPSESFLQDNYTAITPVTRSDRYVYYVPDDPNQIAYDDGYSYFPNTFGGKTHLHMGIIVDGGAVSPNQQSWEYEAVAFFEAIGRGFTLSRSEGDPVGHDIIMSSLPNMAPTTAPTSVENSVFSNFIRGFSETTREVAYNVGRSALGYAVNTAMSYSAQPARLLLT